MDIKTIPFCDTTWLPCFRIIPSRFPPVELFERVANPELFHIIYEIEQITNPRIRQEVGDINLIHREEQIFGEGTSQIMAAFTHLPVYGSRFTDGSYGVYYAGDTIDTAIAETKYHREKFLREFKSPKTEIVMRVLLADLKTNLHDITNQQKLYPDIYHPNDYTISQAFARELRGDGRMSLGIKYSSVRRPEGECAAIFRPKALRNCRQERHLSYVWDGEKISFIYRKQAL